MLKIILFYLGLSKRLRVTEKLQKLYSWRKPIKPYAFIRVHNEIKTIDAALKSVLPVLKGGVIGFNSCTDGTKEYILHFCKKYPQFIPVEYPYDVIPASNKIYMEDSIDIKNRLDSYYNFVWEKLPKNEWIIKIDGDHIWIPEFLENLCRIPVRKKDCIILSRLNLHCYEGKCYIHKKYPILENGDSWILYNRNVNFEFWRGWVDNKFEAYEILHLPKKERKKIFTVCTNWHFPIVKNHRNNFNRDEWVLLQDFDIRKYLKEHKLEGRVPDYMINESNILEAFSRFNHSGEKILP
ncbi:hypothetical protein NSA18_07030 [Pasteurella caecimuris]|uniref:hypothetical protein n=1 Tax=Rodentibacter caecimuris TaxID=1796644 RepID=UPI002150233B|nr:hypothetical protein [Pasteurella caecimuris]MCR1837646.1 hypothetical protein [Pasteurella caecimuris]MCU0106670.1 hypothetical protein [Pasteurella caecimuris]